jgi:ComF family protein
MALLGRLVEAALDLALPPRCLGCGARDRWLCADCAASLPPLGAARCRVCAVPLAGPLVCPSCYRDPPHFAALHAPLQHDGLARELIHALKYRGQRHLAAPLGQLAAGALPGRDYDLVVPVPLHPLRRAERGFNQSELLADQLRHQLQLRKPPGSLVRVRSTVPQVGKDRLHRWENVRGAFAWRGAPLDGRPLMVVDDVATTGATLEACAAALKSAGSGPVTGVTVARVRL